MPNMHRLRLPRHVAPAPASSAVSYFSRSVTSTPADAEASGALAASHTAAAIPVAANPANPVALPAATALAATPHAAAAAAAALAAAAVQGRTILSKLRYYCGKS